MNLRDGMHAPLRDSPAPVMTAVTRALGRGARLISLRAAQQALYLATARGRWLDAWADTYAFDREPGETDAELRARVQSETVLERRKPTVQGVTDAVAKVAGVTPVLSFTEGRVARYDRLADMADGAHMLDYSVTDGWDEAYHNLPDSRLGFETRVPLRGGYDAAGLLVHLPMHHDPAVEARVMAVLARHLPAGCGYDLSWLVRMPARVVESCLVSETTSVNPSGWGFDPWGAGTWG